MASPQAAFPAVSFGTAPPCAAPLTGSVQAFRTAPQRSLAVERRRRSRGLGARLVDAIETEARVRGVTALYLLTTTATTFFERMGYTAHDRAGVPSSIAATTEFSSLCPDTADCLWRDLAT